MVSYIPERDMSRRLSRRFLTLATAVVAVVSACALWITGSVAAQGKGAAAPLTKPSTTRTLRLPDTPLAYASATLPPHFLTAAAQRFDNTPQENPITDWGATLGRVIFYDTRLSANNTTSCGSCHVQSHAFVDPNRFSRGYLGGTTDRHAMNLVNLRYSPRARFFWDERGANLEAMVLMPVQNTLEMGLDITQLPGILARDSKYPDLFRKAFGDSEITNTRISQALAQFLRSMVSYRSRYDEGRVQAQAIAEDFPNYTSQENRGKALFVRNCALCHLPQQQEAHFIMTEPVNTGLDEDTSHTDGGVGDITLNPADMGHFKSPNLRNVEVAAPYMHDGRFPTLDAVIDHYSSGGKNHPNRDIRIQPMHFTNSEKTAIIAFLKTLTDQAFLNDSRFSDPFQ
jgi:cytochrome c peroxidase